MLENISMLTCVFFMTNESANHIYANKSYIVQTKICKDTNFPLQQRTTGRKKRSHASIQDSSHVSCNSNIFAYSVMSYCRDKIKFKSFYSFSNVLKTAVSAVAGNKLRTTASCLNTIEYNAFPF
jgi:hypothetical protein